MKKKLLSSLLAVTFSALVGAATYDDLISGAKMGDTGTISDLVAKGASVPATLSRLSPSPGEAPSARSRTPAQRRSRLVRFSLQPNAFIHRPNFSAEIASTPVIPT